MKMQKNTNSAALALRILVLLTLVIGGFWVARSYTGPSKEPYPLTTEESMQYAEQKSAYAEEQRKAFTSDSVSDGIIEVDFTAERRELVLGEGAARIDAWTYNGELPGQELRMQLGQTLRLNLTNKLDEPTTIHWHGVRVENSMDGVPGVTQEAVDPGETFTYEITPKDAGTYWFHPHYNTSEQIERGLYHALIVEDAFVDSFTLDETWVLDDWRVVDGQLYPYFNTPHDLMHDGRWGNLVTINGSTEMQANWSPGDRIRLRLVNAANARVFKPDFGDLPVDVLAFDGIPTFGSVDYRDLDLAPGNRVDLVVTIPDGFNKETTVLDTFTRNPFALARVTVSGEQVATPEWSWDVGSAVLWPDVTDLPVDQELVLDASRGGMHGINWMINGESFPRHTPIELKDGEFTVMEFVNRSSRIHPMHLHGQFFRVIAIDGKDVSESFWRDTVLVGPKETIRIAFASPEAGDWVLHCHILEHAEAGMMTVLSVE